MCATEGRSKGEASHTVQFSSPLPVSDVSSEAQTTPLIISDDDLLDDFPEFRAIPKRVEVCQIDCPQVNATSEHEENQTVDGCSKVNETISGTCSATRC